MPKLQGIRIQNYRSLHDVTLGRSIERPNARKSLPQLVSLIGPNGCGKSSFMDAFAFIGDCLNNGVESACNEQHRGGFNRIRTQGTTEPMRFEIYYKESNSSRPISYTLEIDANNNIPFISHERLRQRRKGESYGQPYSFFNLNYGKGTVWSGKGDEHSEGKEESVVEIDPNILGISTLANIENHPRIKAFRNFLQGWYLSYFVPELARVKPRTGPQPHLNRDGSNIANYVQYMEKKHPKQFARMLLRIAENIPGLHGIEHAEQDDGTLLLKFFEKGYEKPFFIQDMSDGTIKTLAYLLLLNDPNPAPLVGIEEPENGLHHFLLEDLADTFLSYAEEKKTQFFLTTHSPFLVNGLSPEQVWIMEKDEHGHSTVECSANIPSVKDLYDQDIPLGSLWSRNHFGRGNP